MGGATGFHEAPVSSIFNMEDGEGMKDIRGGSRLVLEHTRRMAVVEANIRMDHAERLWKLDKEYSRILSAQRKWQDILNLLSPSATDRKSTRQNSSHSRRSRMPSSA